MGRLESSGSWSNACTTYGYTVPSVISDHWERGEPGLCFRFVHGKVKTNAVSARARIFRAPTMGEIVVKRGCLASFSHTSDLFSAAGSPPTCFHTVSLDTSAESRRRSPCSRIPSQSSTTMMRFLSTMLLLAAARAFTPPQPRTGGHTPVVVQNNAISSKWTMMPEEPAPEVRC